MTEAEAIELLEEQIVSSTKLRLVADVPVGTFMSGGIDSTTISAIASKLHPGIKAFTLAYEKTAPELDEVSQAVATASMHRMEHIIHRVCADDTLKDLDAMIECYEEPFHSLAPTYVISKRVKNDNITVILNGLGGDELFAGYGHYAWVSRWNIIRRLGVLTRLVRLPGKKGELLRKIASISTGDRHHHVLFSQAQDEERRRLFNDPIVKDIDTVEYLHKLYVGNDVVFDDEIEAMSYMDMMNYIGNHFVHRVDQLTMAHSIEGRFPFLDHHVIEAAFRIPSHLKIKKGSQKYILRKVAEKYIAPECLSMKKKGFGLPLEQWVKGRLVELVCEKLESLKKREIFSENEIQKRYDEYKHGKRSAIQIWHLVATEMWFEKFLGA